ncbi:helix-turn-helix transcriptional regulator [Paenibacillus endoradicis]|uniref:helix-turn-helix transcriptional regulator n=1 Tax=Paenibacillus endoradicis TaxID=2972487 RepID=UPI00215941D4|nr:AraC family transcriptional regulator [Paenibacillus endoradicis]MCR8658861.1 AraC family transcriptional regulator [Paenibacillus endoradicis]
MDNLYEDFHDTCALVQSVTKQDTRFIGLDGVVHFQLIQHSLPITIQHQVETYSAIAEVIQANPPQSYYYYTNSYGLEYIAVGYWRQEKLHGYFLVGPFLTNIPSSDWISQVIMINNLPISERNHLQAFYTSLLMISSSDSDQIGNLLVQLSLHPPIQSQLITAEVITAKLDKEQLKENIEEHQTIIEMRYKLEKQLMHLIENGDINKLQDLMKRTVNIFIMPDRIPESPLRSTKNIFFTLNTLCRIAAERGGLHPVYIHHISEKFSIMIERAPNLPHLNKLRLIILEEYCAAVNTYSTSMYGPIVKEAVAYIQFNLERELSLKGIASELHVNPAHLSRKFLQETNQTIIDFINQKRIEEAKQYLLTGTMSITEIALMVGYNDLNYFGRVFKKFTSQTPREFAKNPL